MMTDGTPSLTRNHAATDRGGAPPSRGTSLKQRLAKLLSAGNYAAARRILVEARNRTPGDMGIQNGLRLVEDRLVKQYARVIGPLDRTPEALTWKLSGPCSTDEHRFFQRIDGTQSFAELLRSSRGDLCDSYKALASLVARGAIAAANPASRRRGLAKTLPAIPAAMFMESASGAIA